MIMAGRICTTNSLPSTFQTSLFSQNSIKGSQFHLLIGLSAPNPLKRCSIRCSVEQTKHRSMRTCKNCKTQFDPSLNHPQACRYHTAHFGGETKRKFESVHSGGTMNTPGSGKVLSYWHCCGSEDPFDPGCTAAPHSSYDD